MNGRGQLGEALKKQITGITSKSPVFIYHTWNPWNRHKHIQEYEYNKFIKFVNEHKHHRIIFTSTYSQNENYYVHYKQLAEAYLISNCKNCLIIRLPSLVGNKGILKKLKEKTVSPFGKIEFLSLGDASKKIVELVSYDGLVKTFSLKGEEISAELVEALLHET